MRNRQVRQLGITLLFLILLLTACRKEAEILPTVIPTAVVPAASPVGSTRDTSEGSQPTPRPSATNTPEAVAIVDPALIDWPPQVVQSSPAAGEEMLLDGSITVRFDQPMDQSSVEAAFVALESTNAEPVSGDFSWPRSDTLIFTPDEKLKRRATYRVSIGEQAASANGFPITEPVELYLATVGYLEVGQVIPDSDVIDVDVDSAIMVMFNRPVVPLAGGSQQAGLPNPLRFQPQVEGLGMWVSTSVYRFQPDSSLAAATTYDVQVLDDFEDLAGSSLEQPFVWSFLTESPAVVSTDPKNGSTVDGLQQPITITFNLPMNRAVTESATSIRSAGAPAVQLDYIWSDGDRVLTLRPQKPLLLASAYQIGIAQAAQAAAGQATMQRDVLSGFSTPPLPAVANTIPSDGGIADRWLQGFSVGFVSPMDWATVEGRVSIDPDPGEVRYDFYDTQMSIDFEMQRNIVYEVTVPGSAQDLHGNTIGRNYTFRFRTPSGEPVASLNLPSQLSQVSNSYPTQVDVIQRNISQLDAALYDLGLPLNLINDPYTIVDFRSAASPIRTWSLPLDLAPEQVSVTSLPLADGEALPTGVYLIDINAPELDESAPYWQNQRHLLIVADTNIVIKEMFGEVHVWATDLASGEPVAGRRLSLSSRAGVQLGNALSDENGLARFDRPLDDYLSGVVAVSNRPGEAGFGIGSSYWSPGVAPWNFGLSAQTNPEPPTFAYIYTDRPIYRPGDQVYFKGIVRSPAYGRYQLPAMPELTVRISRASYSSDVGLDETIKVAVDESGAFSGEFLLPEEMSLGSYQFSLRGVNAEAYRSFTVAEYRKPEFLVNLTADQSALLRGEALDVSLDASYFFGGPAADLEVNWFVYEDSYWPELPLGGYRIADAAQQLSPLSRSLDSFDSYPLGRNVLGGSGVTDVDGHLAISLPADLLADADEGSRRVMIEAQVSGLSELPVTSRTEIIMHAADSYVGISLADNLVAAGKEATVDLRTVNWTGEPAPNQPVEVIVYQRDWISSRRPRYGVFTTLWEPVDREVYRVELQSDEQGKARAAFTPAIGGSYVAAATVVDDSGRRQTSSAYLWVMDGSYVGWRGSQRERRMELVPDKQAYRAGESARILIQSPFSEPVSAWMTIERGTLIEQQLITLGSGSELLEIPISAEFAPNVFVTIAAVKGESSGSSAGRYADIRLGITELVVAPDQFELNVNLTPRETLFQPGETAIYDVAVTDYLGRPVQADISLSLVDLAVLTLKEDNAPDIMNAFYARQPYRSIVGSGLFVSGEGLELEVPAQPLGLGGGGGGDVQEAALGRALGDDDDGVRRDFPDTSFWEASLQTDARGNAVVEIPLPDSLTTWRLSSKAVSLDTLVGQSSTDIVVTLPLLLKPVTPRFLTAGDQFQVGTIVHNNSSQVVEAVVSLEVDGLILHDAPRQTVLIPAAGQQLVQWQAMVEDVRYVDLTFRVEGGGFQDAAKPSFGEGPDKLIPVYRYDAQDIVGTAGELSQAGRRVEGVLLPPGVDTHRGTVDIALSPSLAASMIDALAYSNAEEFLPVCAHSIADRLLPNIITGDAFARLGLENDRDTSFITEWVSQLQGLVKVDGGWGWCYSERSNDWITAYALLALSKAELAGYRVDERIMAAAADYLDGQIKAPSELTESSQVNKQAFLLYALAETGVDSSNEVDQLLAARRALLDPYARGLLLLAYHLVGDVGQNRNSLIADLGGSVKLSASGAHWEAVSQDIQNLGSDVKGTAIIISALAQTDPENGLLPLAVRWLMVARSGSHWQSTHETSWSILALTDWMSASGDLAADYEYLLNLNLAQVAAGSFTPAAASDSETVSLPVAELAQDSINYLDFQRGLGAGNLYYTVFLNSYINAEMVAAVSRGITVNRSYYAADCDAEVQACLPIDHIQSGSQVRVELSVTVAEDIPFVIIEDPIPAGTEALDPGLETTASAYGASAERTDEAYLPGYWGWRSFNSIEFRDEKVRFSAEYLPAGSYQYTYFLQAAIPGRYQSMPAAARAEFFPDIFGRSSGLLFTVDE